MSQQHEYKAWWFEVQAELKQLGFHLSVLTAVLELSGGRVKAWLYLAAPVLSDLSPGPSRWGGERIWVTISSQSLGGSLTLTLKDPHSKKQTRCPVWLTWLEHRPVDQEAGDLSLPPSRGHTSRWWGQSLAGVRMAGSQAMFLFLSLRSINVF